MHCRIVLAIAPLLAAASAANAQTFPRELRDLPNVAEARFDSSYSELTSCWASVRKRTREIRIDWMRTLPDGDANRNRQVIDVGYWPTSVTPFGQDTICVAGFSDDGTALLELVTFDPDPALKPAPEHAPPGERALPRFQVPVASRTRIALPKLARLGPIRLAVQNFGRPTRVFLWLERTRDLWEFDGDEQALVQVLSAAPSKNLPHAPLLAHDYTRFLVGDHEQLGCVYYWSDESDPAVPSLLLCDADRDGALDPKSFRAMRAEDWTTSGLGDNTYRRFYSSGHEMW